MDSDDEKMSRPKGGASSTAKRPFIRPGNSMKETRIEMPRDEDDEPESGPSSGSSPPPPPRKDKRNMRGLWDQYKNFIVGIVIVALIIAIAYWFFAYKPKLDKLKQETEGRGPGAAQRMTGRKGVRFTDQHGQPLEQVHEYEIEQEEQLTASEQSEDQQSAPIRPPPRDPRETIITANDAPASEHAPFEMGRTPPSSRNIDPKRVVSARDLIKVPLASKGDMNHDDVLRRNEEEGIMREQVVSGDVITNPSVASSTDPLLVE